MITNNSPLDYLAAFTIVLVTGALVGFAMSWSRIRTTRQAC